MKLFPLIILIVLIMILPACQHNNGTKNQADGLVSANWSFAGLKLNNVFEPVPAELTGMNIIFSKPGKFQATSSCNSIYGSYSVADKNSIKLDSLSMTKMFCVDSVPMTWEDRYITSLKSSEQFSISNDTLSIRTSTGTEMIFNRKSN